MPKSKSHTNIPPVNLLVSCLQRSEPRHIFFTFLTDLTTLGFTNPLRL